MVGMICVWLWLDEVDETWRLHGVRLIACNHPCERRRLKMVGDLDLCFARLLPLPLKSSQAHCKPTHAGCDDVV